MLLVIEQLPNRFKLVVFTIAPASDTALFSYVLFLRNSLKIPSPYNSLHSTAKDSLGTMSERKDWPRMLSDRPHATDILKIFNVPKLHRAIL